MAMNEATLPIETVPTVAKKQRQHQLSSLTPTIFSLMVLALLYAGWFNREETMLTAESGAGYALGIIGGVLMLLLLLYPLRKKIRGLQRLGPVKYWFRTHMIFGVIGPVCVIFHANYHLGSLNSNVALFCMLLVASSGLVGRYFYKKIHFGLYGGKATLKELGQATQISRGELSTAVQLNTRLQAMLQKIEQAALLKQKGILSSALHVVSFAVLSRSYHFRLRRIMKRALQREAKRQNWQRRELRRHYRELRHQLKSYLAVTRKVAELSFYERLFSLWHVLHLPLFLMMIISGVIHVYAVHAY